LKLHLDPRAAPLAGFGLRVGTLRDDAFETETADRLLDLRRRPRQRVGAKDGGRQHDAFEDLTPLGERSSLAALPPARRASVGERAAAPKATVLRISFWTARRNVLGSAQIGRQIRNACKKYKQ
jgi:hypothetical protein